MNGTETRRAGRKGWVHAALAIVALSAVPAPAAIVDEWRDTLCGKGIIDCRWSRNRFWDDDDEGFAPPPPGR